MHRERLLLSRVAVTKQGGYDEGSLLSLVLDLLLIGSCQNQDIGAFVDVGSRRWLLRKITLACGRAVPVLKGCSDDNLG